MLYGPGSVRPPRRRPPRTTREDQPTHPASRHGFRRSSGFSRPHARHGDRHIPQPLLRYRYAGGVPEPSHTLTVGQVAQRSGVAVSALHFYEAKGLISSTRTSGNQRRYSRDVLRRVAFIRFAQRVGVPLAEIRAALAEPARAAHSHPRRLGRLSAEWRAGLDARIVALQRLRDNLADCIGCGCLSLDRCALANPHDVLAASGPGRGGCSPDFPRSATTRPGPFPPAHRPRPPTARRRSAARDGRRRRPARTLAGTARHNRPSLG